MARPFVRLAMLALATPLLVPACDKDEEVTTVVENSLVFTRADSTVVAMGKPRACCGLYDPLGVNERALQISSFDPVRQEPGWEVVTLLDRAQAGAVITLPTAPVSPSKVPAVSMFVGDSPNELSSDDNDSSGTITVHSFSCDATRIGIRFSVDATLGSEFGGAPTMDVRGSFEATFPARACSR